MGGQLGGFPNLSALLSVSPRVSVASLLQNMDGFEVHELRSGVCHRNAGECFMVTK